MATRKPTRARPARARTWTTHEKAVAFDLLVSYLDVRRLADDNIARIVRTAVRSRPTPKRER